MENFRVRISLRYKLLFLLTALPLVSLGLYLYMAKDLFEKDKVAYVFDSSAMVSRSLATETRIELQGAYATLRMIVEHYDMPTQQFSAVAQELFNKTPKAKVLILFKHSADGKYVKLGELVKDDAKAKAFSTNAQVIEDLRNQAVDNTLWVSANGTQGMVGFSFRLGEKAAEDHMVVVTQYQAEDMVSAFETKGFASSLVMTRSGRISLGGLEMGETDLEVLRNVLKSKANEGASEQRMGDKNLYLISFASVGMGDLIVVSQVDKAKALMAVQVLKTKSILFFAALLASTLLISVVASGQLTSTLRELFLATGKIAQGDFNVQVQARSHDEVGGLAVSFTWMASEVSRLMRDTAEKARMQSELSTVKTVQETLFPAAQTQFGPLKIMGHYEPASECGGDWWNYSQIGNKIYIWIGDATGHGAPAALITSAARSAAAVIESLPDMTPSRALSIMNTAIHQTSKGQMMMTFFMASIDLDAGTLTYASASHDPPYMLRKTGVRLVKRDLVPLNEVNGPRLGDQKGFIYKEVTVPFSPGDMVFFYTDGILDIENPEGKKWGERAFLKTLIESANVNSPVDGKVENLREIFEKFRKGSQLIDDVTMVLCEYEIAERMAA